jgi:hypothetical protein
MADNSQRKEDAPPFTRLSSYLAYEWDHQGKGALPASEREGAAPEWAWKVQIWLLAGILFTLLASCAVLAIPAWQLRKFVKEEWPGRGTPTVVATSSPDSTAEPPPSLEIRLNNPPNALVADGEQAVDLEFLATRGQNGALSDGSVVRFEAAGGVVDPALASTQGGLVRTRFTPDLWQGREQALVVVRVGDVEQAFPLKLEPPPTLSSVQFEKLPPKVKAGSQTVVMVLAQDTEGRPMAGVNLLLRPEPGEAGQFDPPAVITGEDGKAQATYTVGGQPGPVTLVVEAEGRPEVRGEQGLEVVADENRLEVKNSKDLLYTTGTDEVTLSVTLFDALDAPLQAEVRMEITEGEALFPADRNLGVAVTDTKVITLATSADGRAEAICQAGTAPGEVVIQVWAAGQQQEIKLTVEELKPTTITLEPDKTEVVADGQQSVSLVITVLDQRGEPLPNVEVQLKAEPENKGLLADKVTVKENGMDSVLFTPRAGKRGGVVITATAGDASQSITLTLATEFPAEATPTPPPPTEESSLDSDNDDRDDDREAVLGTDPHTPDDKVKAPGNLVATGAPDRIILDGLPAGVVLLRNTEEPADDANYQAVKLQVWVHKDNLNADKTKLVVTTSTPVTLKGGDPTQPPENRPSLTEGANDYTVGLAQEQANGDYFLVEIWGWFLVDYLDRP